MTDVDKILQALLETDEDDLKDLTGPPDHVAKINDTLFLALAKLGVSGDRISTRYSDVYVMCATHAEAHAIAQAGPWKSMAQVVRTNPEHPDAKQWPWLCDIPFANLGGYISGKIKESEEEDDFIDWKTVTPETAASLMKGDILAKEYGKAVARALKEPESKISAWYLGGGWIQVSGRELRPHPDLAALYPHGWSMGYRIRCPKARTDLEYIEQFGTLPPSR